MGAMTTQEKHLRLMSNLDLLSMLNAAHRKFAAAATKSRISSSSLSKEKCAPFGVVG